MITNRFWATFELQNVDQPYDRPTTWTYKDDKTESHAKEFKIEDGKISGTYTDKDAVWELTGELLPVEKH